MMADSVEERCGTGPRPVPIPIPSPAEQIDKLREAGVARIWEAMCNAYPALRDDPEMEVPIAGRQLHAVLESAFQFGVNQGAHVVGVKVRANLAAVDSGFDLPFPGKDAKPKRKIVL